MPGRVTMFVRNLAVHDARVDRAAATLAAAGREVTVLALGGPGLARREARNGYTVVRSARGRVPGLKKAAIHAKMIWRGVRTRAHVYHAHDLNTLAIAWVSARLGRGRLVYDSHEVVLGRSGKPATALERLVERALIGRADAVVVTTRMRAERLGRTYGIPLPHVIRNLPVWRPLQRAGVLRRLARVPDGEPIVLYQGGLRADRGLDRAIEAFRGVPRGVLVLLGEGPEEERLRALAARLGVASRVRLLPPVPLEELHGLTCGADVGLQVLENTSFNHYSTLGNKLFEYLMAGVPVVAADFPMIREVVAGHEVGLLVNPHRPEAIAAALIRLLASPALRARLARNARAAAQTLNWQHECHRLLALYADLARRRSRRSASRVSHATARGRGPRSRPRGRDIRASLPLASRRRVHVEPEASPGA